MRLYVYGYVVKFFYYKEVEFVHLTSVLSKLLRVGHGCEIGGSVNMVIIRAGV